MAVEEGCGLICSEQVPDFEGTCLHEPQILRIRNSCEHFVNNLGIITLVEAGLDWKRLETQSAHNQRQIKVSQFY